MTRSQHSTARTWRHGAKSYTKHLPGGKAAVQHRYCGVAEVLKRPEQPPLLTPRSVPSPVDDDFLPVPQTAAAGRPGPTGSSNFKFSETKRQRQRRLEAAAAAAAACVPVLQPVLEALHTDQDRLVRASSAPFRETLPRQRAARAQDMHVRCVPGIKENSRTSVQPHVELGRFDEERDPLICRVIACLQPRLANQVVECAVCSRAKLVVVVDMLAA